MARFFIPRPIFAWVLAIAVMLAGAFSMRILPVSQYPDIAPTTIRVIASYPGATALAVQNSVTQVIEDSLTGIDGLLYTVSNSFLGRSTVTLTFDSQADPTKALNDVQARVQQAEGQLPTVVQAQGVTVTKSSSSILMIAPLISTDGKRTTPELGNLVEEVVQGQVKRTQGVGDIQLFGSGYAMRIWLDPLKLASFGLTPVDVTTAVAAQNATVSVGSLGTLPVVPGQQFTAAVTAQDLMTSVDDFRNILLKSETGGAAVYLRDVADIEIGQTRYGGDSRLNGQPASGFGVMLATGANAVDTAAAVRETLRSVEAALPADVKLSVAYDTAPFVAASIDKVYRTLAEAVGLVLLVMLLFLQNLRATFVPLVTIPVVLLGAFALLAAAGLTINTLTMFAMVLAIGLLVDDAIVVVENVRRLMEDEGLGPVAATEKSMGQITGALLGMTLVLTAVFLPMAFFGGSTGIVYRQFSVTIIGAMLLSLGVAMSLTPALSASVLRPPGTGTGPGARIAAALKAGIDRLGELYARLVHWTLRLPALMLLPLALALATAATWYLFSALTPTFIPAEDQGVLLASVQLSDGSTFAQTNAVVSEIEQYLKVDEAGTVASYLVTQGFSYSGSGQNAAQMFITLRPYAERTRPDQSAAAIAERATKRFAGSRAGRISFLPPPAVPGLGNFGGFSLYLLDQSGQGTDALRATADRIETIAGDDPRLTNVHARGSDDTAALRINIDRAKAEAMGVDVAQVNAMLSVIFAGREVNDFQLGARLRPVYVQGMAAARMQASDIGRWFARNKDGEMVPLAAFASVDWRPVAPRLTRFNGVDAVAFSGSEAPGYSSGQAMAAMEELVASLPGGYGAAWADLSYQERQSGSQAPYLYTLSALVVFLALAALYESWSIPFAVMLAVPFGIMGAAGATLWAGQANDVYFKVAILATVGLAAKNAILIVEFAHQLEALGKSPRDAAAEAARLRFRPILMTSLAFLLGVTPLAIATGAGAAAQRSIGVGTLGGMAAATVLGLLVVPALYVIVRWLAGVRR